MKEKQLKKIPIIVDTDPGCDDALALIVLFKNIEKFDLKLICSTAGNTPINITTRNVQFFAQNFFPGVRIAKGVESAIVKQNVAGAEIVHGFTGMGNFDPGEQKYPYDSDSAKAMYEVLTLSDEPVTLITLGPLTNIARLLITYPNIKHKIKNIYSMIGSIAGHGNITKIAEFNSYFDAEAFEIVSKAGIQIIFNSIEISEDSRVFKERMLNKRIDGLLDKLIIDIVSGMNEICDPTSVFMYDVNSVVALTNPDLYEFIPCDAKVSTDSETYGQCFLTENSEGIHKYQKIKNINALNNYILGQLFD